MRTPLTQRRPWIWMLSGSILFVSVFAGIANQSWVNEELIKPLYFLWLYLQFYLSSVPGLLFWFILVCLAVVAFGVTLIDLFKQKIIFERLDEKEQRLPLQLLAEKIELASQGNLFRWSLNRDLSEIVIALIRVREQAEAAEARRLFNSGAWTNDDEIRKLLNVEIKPASSQWPAWVKHWFQRRRWSWQPGASADLKKIIAYLEDYARQGGRGATR